MTLFMMKMATVMVMKVVEMAMVMVTLTLVDVRDVQAQRGPTWGLAGRQGTEGMKNAQKG